MKFLFFQYFFFILLNLPYLYMMNRLSSKTPACSITEFFDDFIFSSLLILGEPWIEGVLSIGCKSMQLLYHCFMRWIQTFFFIFLFFKAISVFFVTNGQLRFQIQAFVNNFFITLLLFDGYLFFFIVLFFFSSFCCFVVLFCCFVVLFFSLFCFFFNCPFFFSFRRWI